MGESLIFAEIRRNATPEPKILPANIGSTARIPPASPQKLTANDANGEIPTPGTLTIECVTMQACTEYFVHTPLPRSTNEALARVLAHRRQSLGAKQEGLSATVKPMEEPKGFMGGGSTDVSDVSWNVPTASLSVACYPISSPGHSWAITTCSGSK